MQGKTGVLAILLRLLRLRRGLRLSYVNFDSAVFCHACCGGIAGTSLTAAATVRRAALRRYTASWQLATRAACTIQRERADEGIGTAGVGMADDGDGGRRIVAQARGETAQYGREDGIDI